jgi:ADP-dependent NAD(P)H-hydrate dehydratase
MIDRPGQLANAAQQSHDVVRWPTRARDAHKGTCGTVVIVAGCCEPRSFMAGAAMLAARGALRSGAGLVRVVCPLPLAPLVLSSLPSATVCAYEADSTGHASPSDAAHAFDAACEGASCIVVGCGLGQSEHARALVYRSLSFVGSGLPGRGAVALADVPVVLDADGLRLLAEMRVSASEVRRPLVLTPHPGEFAALAQAMAVDFSPKDASDAARVRAADAVAQKLGCIVVLKGHRSVVSNGHDAWVCNAGHPCMATAGTGDVLAGALGGLLGQHVERTRRTAPTAGELDASELDALRALAMAKLGKLAQHAGPAKAPPASSNAAADQQLSLLDCVKVGVLAHARAGETWARRAGASAGILASELADELPGQIALLSDAAAGGPGSPPHPSTP